LSIKNSREPRNHMEPGRNLAVDCNAIVHTKLDLVGPTMATNYRGIVTGFESGGAHGVMNNGMRETRGFRQVQASLRIITLRPMCVVV
jgi:hypothetical protein